VGKVKVTAEPGKHDILVTREFNAPRELVFKALTDPALISRWWGPKGVTTIVDRMEVKQGGVWRYVQHDENGEYGFHGVYHSIESPERMVYTFEFEGLPGHVLLETVTLEEHGGKTIIKDSSIFQSVEDRDGMIQSGRESGAVESWDRLEEILLTMKT
jgi:uncharacterized protein YndB with AHSA1/START domain